jgi:2'-5' RNA ligase
MLLLAPPVADEIDGLRRACGAARAVGVVAPHVTLVPPVNVRHEALPEALAVLRAAAAARADAGPLQLTIGPAAMFHPVSSTLYLAVGGDVDGVRSLREALFRAPLARTVDRPFTPHVTLAGVIGEDRARAAVEALADYTASVVLDRLHLLEERRVDGTRWVPVADAAFERPTIVGRGGVELELHRCRLTDPEALELAGALGDPPDGAVPLVLTARRRGRLVGVAQGWVRDGEPELTNVIVVEDQRGQGIARQLRLALAASS